jgi:hypothetical protein
MCLFPWPWPFIFKKSAMACRTQQVKKGFLLHKTGAGIKLNSKFKTEQGNLVEY